MAKMCQNRLQCTFGDISFHAGVYLEKYNLKIINLYSPKVSYS